MLKKILDSLMSDDLDDISYELARRMRRHKPINPLDPLPQTKPIQLSDGLLKIIDQVQAEIEAKYQTKIDLISDEDEAEILTLVVTPFFQKKGQGHRHPKRGFYVHVVF